MPGRQPVSKTSIFNRCFGFLAGEPTGHADDLKDAQHRWADALYDQIYMEALSLWPFQCTRRRARLVRDRDRPAFGYASAYRRPSDALKVFAARCQRWEREGAFVLADARDALDVFYIENVDEAALDAPVAAVIGAELALAIAAAMSESSTILPRLQALAETTWRKAIAQDQWEGSAEFQASDDWSVLSMVPGPVQSYVRASTGPRDPFDLAVPPQADLS